MMLVPKYKKYKCLLSKQFMFINTEKHNNNKKRYVIYQLQKYGILNTSAQESIMCISRSDRKNICSVAPYQTANLRGLV